MKAACLLTPSRPNVWWDERGRLAIGLDEIAAKIATATTGQVLPVGRLDDNVIAKLAITTQADRSAGNGISVAQQKKLDKLAREAPNLLRQVQAGERSCHSACIEAGFVKVDTPDEKALKALCKADNPDEVWETFSAERCGLTA